MQYVETIHAGKVGLEKRDGRYFATQNGAILADFGKVVDLVKWLNDATEGQFDVVFPAKLHATPTPSQLPSRKPLPRPPKMDYAQWWADAVGLTGFNLQSLGTGLHAHRSKKLWGRHTVKGGRRPESRYAHKWPYGPRKTW